MASSSLDVGYLLLVDSGILLSMVVQQLVAVLALSQEECAHVLIRRHLETEVRAMILILPCTVALLGMIRFGEETKFPMPQ